MKPRQANPILALVAIAAGLLLSACSTTRNSESERFLYLDTNDTLQIQFTYYADPQTRMSSPSLADEDERQRFDDYYETMTRLLLEVDLPMNYRILKQGESPDVGNPVLELHALRWKRQNVGEINAVIQAKLHSYGEFNKLGTFQGSAPEAVLKTHDLILESYRSALRKALADTLFALNAHFEPAAPPTTTPAE